MSSIYFYNSNSRFMHWGFASDKKVDRPQVTSGIHLYTSDKGFMWLPAWVWVP